MAKGKVELPKTAQQRYLEIPVDPSLTTEQIKREKTHERKRLQTTIEQNELPDAMYSFKRSRYEVPDTEKGISSASAFLAQKLRMTDFPVKVELHGTADNTNFKLDPGSPTPRVNLNYGASWQNDFLYAFNTMKGNPSYPELTTLDFARKGISAIHDLSLTDQQKMMNHAIAYLRAMRLQKQLMKDNKDHKRLVFDIKTEWKSDPNTRTATLMKVTTEHPPRPPEPEEEKPLNPKDIIPLIEKINHKKYALSKTAIFKVPGLIPKQNQMRASTLVQNLPDGTRNEYEMYFITTKPSNENPSYYLSVDKNDPFTVRIGKMEYTSGFLSSKSDYGAIEHVLNIDKTNRANAMRQIQELFNVLP